MKPTIEIDTRQFARVLQEYAKLNRRTFPEIVNAKALDVAFRALKETPKASTEAIKGVVNKPWWPKYVAKRIAGGVRFRKGKSKINIQGKGFSREDAKLVSDKIISGRLRSVAFLKSGWLPAIRRLYPLVKEKLARGGMGGAREYGQPKGSARPAATIGENPSALIINSAIGIDKMGVQPLQRAVDGAAADMADYIGRKIEQNARRVAR